MSKADVYIIDGIRTPIGRFGGSLKDYTAPDLGGFVLKALLDKIGIPREKIDIILMGQVIRAGSGQDTARQAAIKAGIPPSIDAITIDMVCSSGMASIILASSMIKAGDARNGIILAGGMESMSHSPFIISPKFRWGVKFILREKFEIIDSMYYDGLYDVIENQVMGVEADRVAREMNVTREELDEIGCMSQMRAEEATKKGYFKREIVPIKKDDETVIEVDEGIRPGTTLEKISRLPPAFGPEGLHTAATSSQLSDGAAALILANEDAVSKYDLEPKAKIISYSWASGDTWRFVYHPAEAVKKLLSSTGYSFEEIDIFENNEAFAISSIIMNKILGVAYDKLNIFGGAIALGHPIGCTGARITVTLLNIMEIHGYKRGIASLCHGLGGATALLIEKE